MWTALFGQISTQSEMARRVGNNLNQTRNREKAQRREGKVLSVISSWKIFDHANCIQNSLYCLILFSLFCVELKSSYRTNRFCSSLPSIFSHKQKHTDAPNPSTRITNIFLCFSLVQGSGFFPISCEISILFRCSFCFASQLNNDLLLALRTFRRCCCSTPFRQNTPPQRLLAHIPHIQPFRFQMNTTDRIHWFAIMLPYFVGVASTVFVVARLFIPHITGINL